MSQMNLKLVHLTLTIKIKTSTVLKKNEPFFTTVYALPKIFLKLSICINNPILEIVTLKVTYHFIARFLQFLRITVLLQQQAYRIRRYAHQADVISIYVYVRQNVIWNVIHIHQEKIEDQCVWIKHKVDDCLFRTTTCS